MMYHQLNRENTIVFVVISLQLSSPRDLDGLFVIYGGI